jgi:hypothetical protein
MIKRTLSVFFIAVAILSASFADQTYRPASDGGLGPICEVKGSQITAPAGNESPLLCEVKGGRSARPFDLKKGGIFADV